MLISCLRILLGEESKVFLEEKNFSWSLKIDFIYFDIIFVIEYIIFVRKTINLTTPKNPLNEKKN